MTLKTVHLVMKPKQYNAIESGKTKVVRRDNIPKWQKRIFGGSFIVLHKGYTDDIIMFKIQSIVRYNPQIEIFLGEQIDDLPRWIHRRR